MEDLEKEIKEFSEDKLKDAQAAILEGRLPKYAYWKSYFELDSIPDLAYASLLFSFRLKKEETEAVANHFRLFLESQTQFEYRTRDTTKGRWSFVVEQTENSTNERSYNVFYEPVYSEPEIWGSVIIQPVIRSRDPLIKSYFESLSFLNIPSGLTLDQVLHPEDYV